MHRFACNPANQNHAVRDSHKSTKERLAVAISCRHRCDTAGNRMCAQSGPSRRYSIRTIIIATHKSHIRNMCVFVFVCACTTLYTISRALCAATYILTHINTSARTAEMPLLNAHTNTCFCSSRARKTHIQHMRLHARIVYTRHVKRYMRLKCTTSHGSSQLAWSTSTWPHKCCACV